MLPDLRTPHPSRTEITPDTITLMDLVARFKSVNDAIVHLEHNAESVAATQVKVKISEFREWVDYFDQRVSAVRWFINNRHLHGKRSVIADSPATAWAKRREENKRKHYEERMRAAEERRAAKEAAREAKRAAYYGAATNGTSQSPPTDSQ